MLYFESSIRIGRHVFITETLWLSGNVDSLAAVFEVFYTGRHVVVVASDGITGMLILAF